MTRLTLLTSVIALSATAVFASDKPRAPSDAELRIIETALAERMPLTARIMTADVIIGDVDKDGLRFVCGNVLSPTTDPARPASTPFMGAFADGAAFMIVAIAEPDAASQAQVAIACLDRV